MRILVTTARAPAALELARHLHRAGHEILLADSRVFSIARYSRYSRKYFRVCPPRESAEQYCNDLCDIIRRESVDLLIPVFEETLHIAAGIEQFRELTQVFCDDIDKLTKLHNKFSFARDASAAGLTVPETHLVDSQDSLSKFVERSANFVFKPVYSRFGDQVLIAPNPEDLETVKPSPQAPWVAQEYIEGDLYCSFNVAHRGHLRAHCSYRPSCFAGRAGILFSSTQEIDILSQVRKLIESIEFNGFISFDFIRDPSGRFHVIECNPRTTSGIHFFDSNSEKNLASNNHVSELSRAILEPHGPFIQSAANQQKMLAFALAIYGWSKKNRVCDFSRFQGLLRSARDVIFSWKDPLPMFVTPLMLAENMIAALSSGVLMTRSGTFDHEWNEPLSEITAAS